MKKKEISIAAALAIFIPVLVFFALYYHKIAPGVYIAGTNMGGKTMVQAQTLLVNKIKPPKELRVTIEADNAQQFLIPLETIEFSYQFEQTVDNAYKVGKSGNIPKDFATLVSLLDDEAEIPLTYTINEEKLQEYISTIAGQASIQAAFPRVQLVNSNIVVETGKKGYDINPQAISQTIARALAQGNFDPIVIKLTEVDPTLSAQEAEDAKVRAEKLINKSIQTKFDDANHFTFETITIRAQALLDLINPKGGVYFDNLKLKVEEIAKTYNREAINPVFEFAEGRVKEFQPAKPGIEVRQQELAEKLADAITSLENSDTKVVEVSVPINATDPKITTSEVNDLGIKELIGRGTSRYRGSIASRVHNVNLAASRINGVLVAPGETFSFNNSLGDVSKLTGYKEAYVIQDGKTVLGDGGGVCQVSSTLFRAILNAGLPITERRAHSYRVGYYEQESSVGFDATVYAPTTDLKFKNDTPAHILIQTISDPRTYSLAFEIYGTSDGRVATVTKPVVTDVVAPAEDLYVDDPTLPTGQIRQVEYKAWGAKSTFYYEVKRGDEVIYKKTFVSTYRPWQAVYMRGTGPAI